MIFNALRRSSKKTIIKQAAIVFSDLVYVLCSDFIKCRADPESELNEYNNIGIKDYKWTDKYILATDKDMALLKYLVDVYIIDYADILIKSTDSLSDEEVYLEYARWFYLCKAFCSSSKKILMRYYDNTPNDQMEKKYCYKHYRLSKICNGALLIYFITLRERLSTILHSVYTTLSTKGIYKRNVISPKYFFYCCSELVGIVNSFKSQLSSDRLSAYKVKEIIIKPFCKPYPSNIYQVNKLLSLFDALYYK